MAKGLRWAVCGAAVLLGAATARAELFDWASNSTPTPPALPGYTPAPYLRNTTGAAVSGYLAGQPTKAVTVDYQDLLPATISQIYDVHNVKYTFSDYEGPGAILRTQNLANQIRSSLVTGPAVNANTSFVGNFDLAPLGSDTTRPGGTPPYTFTEYLTSGVNMASESLYPGSPSFRSPANGNSSAPNLRSSFFTLPITRTSLVTASMPLGHQHVPFVARFNNTFNSALDTDQNPGNGFRFENPTGDQMLSRGDFKAMIAHYRARGINGAYLHTIDEGPDGGGVVGYTANQARQDVRDGWNFSPFDSIYAGGGARSAILDTVIRSDGVVKTLEDAGMVASGVYSLTQNKLALLVSNLDELGHSASFLNKIGGKTIAGSFAINPGQHRLLEFTGAGTQWNLVTNTPVFVDNDRAGVGVPEPAMAGGIALFGLLGFCRRRRRAA